MRFRGQPGPMNKGPGKIRTAASKETARRNRRGEGRQRIGAQSGRWPRGWWREGAGFLRLALLRACRPVPGVASSTARSVTKVTAGALDMDYCSSVVIGAISVSRDPSLQEGVVSCARP